MESGSQLPSRPRPIGPPCRSGITRPGADLGAAGRLVILSQNANPLFQITPGSGHSYKSPTWAMRRCFAIDFASAAAAATCDKPVPGMLPVGMGVALTMPRQDEGGAAVKKGLGLFPPMGRAADPGRKGRETEHGGSPDRRADSDLESDPTASLLTPILHVLATSPPTSPNHPLPPAGGSLLLCQRELSTKHTKGHEEGAELSRLDVTAPRP